MKKKLLCLTLCAVLAGSMAGCSASTPDGSAAEPSVDGLADQTTSPEPDETEDAMTAVPAYTIDEMFTDRDREAGYDGTDGTAISLNGTEIQCSADSVEITGTTAVIRETGTYILTGKLENGQIIVEAGKDDKVQLVLDGAAINCDTSAAIYVRQADKVFLTLAADSENRLSNTADFTAIDDNNIDGVLFAKSDLTLNGSGALTINAAYGHGVVSKDDLAVTGGSYTIDSAGHGLSGKDSVRILDGSFVINSGKDGVHSEHKDDSTLGFIYIAGGTFRITAQGDGFDAATVLQADGGAFTITAGGGSRNAVDRAEKGGEGGRPGGGPGGKTGRPGEGPGTGEGAEGGTGRPGEGAEMSEVEGVSPGGNPRNRGQRPQAVIEGAADANTTSDPDTSPSTKGLKAGTLLLVRGGDFTINTADDALHSNGNLTVQNGSLNLASGDDGMHADAALTVSGGTVDISTCYEGLEGQTIEISGGVISLISADDGLNAAGGNDGSGFNGGSSPDSFSGSENHFIRISGGVIRISASGDGIDSNGSFYVTGGEIYVDGPENGGDSALDYDGDAVIEGGLIIAAGSGKMAQNFSQSSSQGAILTDLTQPQNAGTTISLADSSGEELISYTPKKTSSNVLVSCPGLTQGQTYELTAGTETISITLDSLIYGAGGMGMRGGGPR